MIFRNQDALRFVWVDDVSHPKRDPRALDHGLVPEHAPRVCDPRATCPADLAEVLAHSCRHPPVPAWIVHSTQEGIPSSYCVASLNSRSANCSCALSMRLQPPTPTTSIGAPAAGSGTRKISLPVGLSARSAGMPREGARGLAGSRCRA